MRYVSPFLKHVAYPVLHHSRVLGRALARGSCAVVNYHGVLPDDFASGDSFLDGNLVSKDALQKQLRLLKSRYHVISPDDFHKWLDGHADLPPRAVLITCDDGLMNTLTDMLPLLKNEGVSCLFFVLGASCCDNESRLWYEQLYRLLASERGDRRGTRENSDFHARWWHQVQEASRLGWEERKEWMKTLESRCGMPTGSAAPGRWRLLNADQVRQVAAEGMEIGAHTVSHPVLSVCSDDMAHWEIEQSKREIERALGRLVWAFAYPFGNPGTMGDREVRLARQAGFKCAFVNTGGGKVDRSRPFTLCRTHVTSKMNLAEFEAHVSGLHHELQRAVRG